jgi:hypothetical protein
MERKNGRRNEVMGVRVRGDGVEWEGRCRNRVGQEQEVKKE